MRKLFFLLLIALSFWNCEDKEKAPDRKPAAPQEVKVENPSEEAKSIQDVEIQREFPFITNENVSEFLTAYGKENPETSVVLETPHGTLYLELYTDTPLHRANFIYMVKNGYLSTTYFHRVVENFIIQGGNSDNRTTNKMRSEIGNYTIPAEIKHTHVRGALAAAKEYRENPGDRSSPYEFYIVQSPGGAHHLDKNYTVFGKVVSEMKIVDIIAKLETDNAEWPVYDVPINASIPD